MILRLSLDLPEDSAFIRTTRLLSRCLLEDINVTTQVIDDVETILTELCSNVIRHARTADAHFTVTLEYCKPKVVITVVDSGPGFTQKDVLPVGTMRADGVDGKRIGGFGMELIEGMSDKLDFTSTFPHGTTVRAEKNLRYNTKADENEAIVRDQGNGAVATIGTH